MFCNEKGYISVDILGPCETINTARRYVNRNMYFRWKHLSFGDMTAHCPPGECCDVGTWTLCQHLHHCIDSILDTSLELRSLLNDRPET